MAATLRDLSLNQAKSSVVERMKLLDAQAKQNLGRGATPDQVRAEYQRLRQIPQEGRQLPGQQGVPQDLTSATLQLLQQKYNVPGTFTGSPAQRLGQQTAAILGQSPAPITRQLSAVPGFKDLTLRQAEQLQGTLEGRQRERQQGLTGFFGSLGKLTERENALQRKLVEEQQQAKNKSAEDLQKRRTVAINNFQQLREAIGKKGVVLDAAAGKQFLEMLRTSDDPEQVLQDYTTLAFAQPKVQQAFTPVSIRKLQSGGTSKAAPVSKLTGLLKQGKDLQNMSKEEQKNVLNSIKALKNAQSTKANIINFDDL